MIKKQIKKIFLYYVLPTTLIAAMPIMVVSCGVKGINPIKKIKQKIDERRNRRQVKNNSVTPNNPNPTQAPQNIGNTN
ncbi:Uncharacterised protein [Mesomycoplasma conjunctivae]|nr:Uncharacterised protein [Mesomycoplasma conjunctivae]